MFALNLSHEIMHVNNIELNTLTLILTIKINININSMLFKSSSGNSIDDSCVAPDSHPILNSYFYSSLPLLNT